MGDGQRQLDEVVRVVEPDKVQKAMENRSASRVWAGWLGLGETSCWLQAGCLAPAGLSVCLGRRQEEQNISNSSMRWDGIGMGQAGRRWGEWWVVGGCWFSGESF